jgi:N-acyl-D-amino-acid deacylase
MLDCIIKGGLVVDGTGSTPVVSDIAVRDGKIVRIAPAIDEPAAELIDASGKIVTPGFIDIHTHYDGQVSWDDQLLPSTGHGVTTLVIGCCGIGFAPVRKGAEDWLIRIMEGVEDIPGSALNVGITWRWESFPDYLDALGERRFAADVAAQVPHSAVRAYVLGRRAEEDAPATHAELDEMASIVRDSIRAGAVGLGTSRVTLHRGSDGGNVPGTAAPEEELLTLVSAMRDAGGGVFQLIPSGLSGGVGEGGGEHTLAGLKFRDAHTISEEVRMMRRLHRATGQPVTFTFAESEALGEAEYQRVLAEVTEIEAAGERIHPQFAPRAAGGIHSLDGSHIFTARPSYQAIAHLPVAERARRMADPAVKAAILAEEDIDPNSDNPMLYMHKTLQKHLGSTYSLDDGNYEPQLSESIVERARDEGRDPFDLTYDLLIAREGRGVLIWMATSYVQGNLDRVARFLESPQFVMGLGDGGAHVQLICDASFPTFMLSYWGRDRKRGRTFPVEQLVRKLTKDPADLYAFNDRGVLAEGKRADINVIDFEQLTLDRPHMAFDLPTGARRLLQDTSGYSLTMVNGVVVRRDDRDTQARPGRLVRSTAARAGQAAAPSSTERHEPRPVPA